MKIRIKAFISVTLLLVLLFGMAAPIASANSQGWFRHGSTWYFRQADGSNATGWLQDGSTWYFMQPSGAMSTGWIRDGSTWYYMRTSGAMATGWQQVGSVWYYLHSSGAMATGWLQLGSTWYYLQPSGAMATGWLQLGSTWYYLQSSGAMATGAITINGVRHEFRSSGAWVEQAGSGMSDFAAEVIRLVNLERAKHGVSAVSGDNSMLNSAAATRAREIVGRFSHTRPDGRAFSTAYTELGGRFTHIGENLANGLSTPAAAVQAWMNSTTHRGTILNPRYTHLGVGVEVDGAGRFFWAQMFVVG